MNPKQYESCPRDKNHTHPKIHYISNVTLFPVSHTLFEPNVHVLSKLWRITSSLGESKHTEYSIPSGVGVSGLSSGTFSFLDPPW